MERSDIRGLTVLPDIASLHPGYGTRPRLSGGTTAEWMSMTATNKTLRTLSDVAVAGFITDDKLPALEQVAARYAIAITPAIAGLIDASDPHDPIARQFVPDA